MGFVSDGIVIGFLHSNGMIIVTHGIVGYNMENRDKNYLVESSHGIFLRFVQRKIHHLTNKWLVVEHGLSVMIMT